MTQNKQNDGPALAAVLAAGIGCFVLGLATVLAEASPAVKEILTWWPPAGPLTGKTGAAVIAWVVSWLLLHLRWRQWEIPFNKIFSLSLTLIALGWVGTFPPFFELFGGH